MRAVVVIPCFKVEKHIRGVIAGLPLNLYAIIAVNDASPDHTGDELKQLSREYDKLIVIEHEINKGVGGAMLTGYSKALEMGADIVIKVDGDGQMDGEMIPSLIAPIVSGKADFTKGNRFRDFHALRQMPFSRRLGNLGLSFMIKAASGYWNIFDPTNGYTAISGETLKSIPLQKIHLRYFFETSILLELYYSNAVVIDVPMKARYGDEVSNLSSIRAFLEFPPKLFVAGVRRIILKYFLFDFNIASVYLLLGIPLFFLGAIDGLISFVKNLGNATPLPTATVIIPTLLITLGFQLLLSAINYDISNYPQRKN